MYSNLHEPSTSYSPPRDPAMSTSPTHYATSDSSYNRRPPGLSSSPPGTNGSYFPSSASSVPIPAQRPRRDSFSVSPPSSRSPPDAAFVSRRNSVDTRPPPPPSSRTSPQDPRAAPVPNSNSSSGRPRLMSISTRNVRWDQNLVCPSPVPLEERRKGWFNRRGYVFSSFLLPLATHISLSSSPFFPSLFCSTFALLLTWTSSLSSDQLWTNGGSYKPPNPGEEYPRDLHFYPEVGQGWMNEEGIKIDMQHRLIPKVPQKSALKRPMVPRHANTW